MALCTEFTVEVGEECGTELYDARAAALGLYDKACSIKDLLQGQVRATQDLEKAVGEFCARDFAEEDTFRKISLDVTHAEMQALRDLRYVAFSQSRVVAEEGVVVEAGTSVFSVDGGVGSCVSRMLTSLGDVRPDANFSLSNYCGVIDVLMGWRSVTPASRVQLDLLLQSMEESVEDISSCVLLLNGCLYTPSNSFHCHGLTQEELDSIIGSKGCASAEEALVGWLNVIVKRSLLSRILLQRLLSSSSEFEESGLRLLCDDVDTLVIVNHKRLLNSAVFRGFFFLGELRGVEAVGAQANVIPVLFTVNKDGERQTIEDRVIDVFRTLWKQRGLSSCGWKSVVLTLAVQAGEFASSYGGAGLMCAVVLDLRPLSPNIPFRWHFSWGEVCALGQLSPSDGNRTCCTDVPVFKMTRVVVAYLEPYDNFSRLMFPLINRNLRLCRKQPPPTFSASYVVAAIILSVVGFAVGRWVFGFRQGR